MKFLVTFLLVLMLSVSAFADDAVDNYELALKAYTDEKSNEAFIYLKNALQENPHHLPSRILLSKVYFNEGNLSAVEDELNQALELGADINLVLPVLGAALILQKKGDDLLDLEKYRPKFSKESTFEWALLKGHAYLLKQDEIMAQMQFEKAQSIYPENVRGLNTLANLYAQLGLLDKAERLINKSMDIDHENEKTWTLKGDLAQAREDYSAALENYERAFQLDSDDPKVIRGLANLNLRFGRLDEVQRYVDLILEQSPNEPTATLLNAWMLMSKDNVELAEQSMAELSARLSTLDENALNKDKSLLFIQGASEYIQGNLESAQQHLEGYLDKMPNDIGAIRLLAEVYAKAGDPRKAIGLLENKKEVIADDLELAVKLVELYIQDNNLLSAEQILRRIKPKVPNVSLIHYLEAQIEKSRKRPQQALMILDRIGPQINQVFPYQLLRGELLLQVNDLIQANEVADQFIKQGLNQIDANNYIAAVHIKSDEPEEALAYIEKVLAQDSSNINALFNKAIILKGQGQTEAAIEILNGLLKRNAKHAPSLLLLARMDLQAGEAEKAIAWLNKILVYAPDNLAALEMKLSIYKQQQNWVEALNTASQLNKLDRVNPVYIVENINLLNYLERYKESDRYLKILSSLWSEQPQNLRNLARLQANAQQPEAAITSLENSIRLDDSQLSAHLELVRFYYQRDRIQDAEKLINRAQSKFGKHVAIFLLKGDLSEAKSKFEQARKYYNSALEIEPNNQSAIIKLYQLALKKVGEKQFDSLMEEKVKDKDAPLWQRKLLADNYLNQGKWDLAQKHYETLIKVPALANDAGILNNLANIYAPSDLEKAVQTARKGLEQGKKSSAMLDTMGWLLAKQDKYSEALPYLRDAYSMNVSSGEIRYHIGYTLLMLGRKTEGKAELQAAIEYGDTFTEYADAQKLLESLN